MKKIIFTLAIILSGIQNTSAQMHISTFLRRDAIFNETTNEYDLQNEDKEELTFFEFNKELTMFKHITPTITSAYTIKSSKEDKENDRWEFDIMSDIGNKYLMILDLKNDNIRIIYKKKGTTYLVQHSIKKIWLDE
jgi:hypothetical protein